MARFHVTEHANMYAPEYLRKRPLFCLGSLFCSRSGVASNCWLMSLSRSQEKHCVLFLCVMHRAERKNSLNVFPCSTQNTSCTAITNSSVRFEFCITVTAHSDGWNISSQHRCQSGRIEGEAAVLLLLLPPGLFLSDVCLTPPTPVFLSDVTSSDLEQHKASQAETSVPECDLELHAGWVSCLVPRDQKWTPDIPSGVHGPGEGLSHPNDKHTQLWFIYDS